jgi:hypothetical protein
MNNTKTLFQHSLYYGAILGITSILINVLSIFLPDSLRQNMLVGSGLLLAGVGVTVYVFNLACQAYRQGIDGYISFSQAFKISLWVGLISSSMSICWTFLYLYVIDANAFKNQLQKARLDLEAQNMPDDQIEQVMKISEMFTQPYVLLPMAFVTSMLFVLIVGAIFAAVIKKEKPHPFDDKEVIL